ncbi:MAG: hypothetical protein M1819_000552 [Sarea resinae]|nr:MAG: hypothetical protein M1819_000552 [Sarea resinae]
MFDEHAHVSVAEVVYYFPVFFLAIWLTIKHRSSGWCFLILLSVLRIVGPACLIASESSIGTKTDFTIAAIFSSVGLSPLILSMLGLIHRAHRGITNSHGLPSLWFHLLHVTVLAALALAIVGGIKESHDSSSDVSTGHALVKAAIVLFTVIFLVQAGIALFTLARIQHVAERRIIYAVCISLPFLAVRLAFSLAGAFDTKSLTFNVLDGNVWAFAFMALFEEFIVVGLYLALGFLLPSPRELESQRVYGEDIDASDLQGSEYKGM